MSVNTFNLYDLFERNAKVFPERESLVFHDEPTTFKALGCKINHLVGTFKAKDIKKGDRIAVLALNRPEFFTILGAAAKIGAIVVPVNGRLSVKEIDYILSDTTPKLLFISSNFEELISSALPGHGYLKEIIIFEESKLFVPFRQFLDEKELGNKIDVEGDDPVLIVHTAAVTGKPLGAVLTHANILASNMQYMCLMGLSEKDVYLNTLPLFHMAGFTLAMAVLHAGGKNVVVTRFDPSQTLDLIEKAKVTMIGCFPPMLSKLLESMAGANYDLSSLRHIRGIEDPETIREFKGKCGAEFWTAYGQTETAGAIAICPYFERLGSVGKSSPISKINIVDEYDCPVESNTEGEILVRGPLVFKQYWNEAEMTMHTLRGGWHHTGDVGRMDEKGYLWFIKRKAEKELIKSGGENVYPKEIEEVIKGHPQIKEVAVIGVRDKDWGEAVKAICVLKSPETVTAQELIDFLSDKIAKYKRPKHIEYVDSLPTLKDGRLDRERIKTLFGNPHS
jgi:acyl-CoA synthetase (AMP-forming)/AMP-acid ligase II